MDKVIKEFKENEYTYKLGYHLIEDKVYPRIVIYKNEELLSGGGWNSGTYGGLFDFGAHYSSSGVAGTFGTIKEVFTWLRKYSDIPEEVEKEFKNMFILYKLNDFNEL